MAAIDDLIKQIEDPGLRARIDQEFHKVSKKKKFGLVFEEHLPEATPLYDIPIKRGVLVAEKQGEISDIYVVTNIDAESNTVTCVNKESNEECQFQSDDLVTVAQFGDPIYPYLKPIDTVCNAPDSALWHTLIEADNYHALQLLEYLYAGKVDCIYIDPPYNSGAKDWKYNNDYVDGNDAYRHSKWLSFMERRLKLAKKLLNPKDSVLIVTIDEKEYLHLGCLLEELFSGARIQMISSVINPTGNNHANEFSRTNEYLFMIMIGSCEIEKTLSTKTLSKDSEVHWEPLKRSDLASRRGTTKGGTMQFYPIYVNKSTKRIEDIGKHLLPSEDIGNISERGDLIPVFPIRDNGIEMNWGLVSDELKKRMEKGYVRVGKYKPDKPQKFSISYLTTGTIADIEEGRAQIRGYSEDGSVKAYYVEDKKSFPTTQWNYSSHDAKNYGTGILKTILPDRVFPFPKSLYAVEDALKIFISNKPEAIIVDFFAGSGTTLHAVNLLNTEDEGARKCIMVTNNEVSDTEARDLANKGFKPGDDEWEHLGIAKYVTWPRTVCSIEGHDSNGKPLKDNYLGSDMPMSNGFKSNVAFFKLGFLDKTEVALGRQFKEMLPTLWMKNGCIGPCPALTEEDAIPDMMILHENRMAILIDEKAYAEFKGKVNQATDIDMAFIITDSEDGYREMANGLHVAETCQLYRDYLDNFRINVARR